MIWMAKDRRSYMGLFNGLTDSARLALALAWGGDDRVHRGLYSAYPRGDSTAGMSLALTIGLGPAAVGSRGKMFEDHNKIGETGTIERSVAGSSDAAVVIIGSPGCASSWASFIACVVESTESGAEESWGTSSAVASGWGCSTAHSSVGIGRGVDGCDSSCGGEEVCNFNMEGGGDGDFMVVYGGDGD
ncbi:hypothetical protein Droror1_Dr00020698 [Drosera rotundifolia]